WRTFSRRMIAHHNQDMADWIAASGIPRGQIFAHQTPVVNPEFFGDTLDTAVLHDPDGTALTGGITAFGTNARRYDLFQELLGRGVRSWGLFEYNPTQLSLSDPAAYQDAMTSLLGIAFSDVSLIAPYKWPNDDDL